MQIKITGQAGDLITADQLVAGSENLYTAEFTFDGAWDGFVKTAVFRAGSLSKEGVLVDDRCIVPHEVLISGAVLYVGVYGVNGDMRMPTVWVRAGVVLDGPDQPGQQAPSPTVYEQLLTAMGDLSTLKTTIKTSLVAAINEIWSKGGGGGAAGVGVKDADVNEEGHLIITLTDETELDAGYVIGPKGDSLTFEDLTEEQKEELKGDTPEKGVDYWTPDDKQEMVNEVLASFTDVSKEGL